jgi:hypothetical protein
MYVAYVAYMWLSVAWPIYPNTNMQAALIDRGPNALRCVALNFVEDISVMESLVFSVPL